MSDWPATSSHLLPNPEDQIPELIQETLNLIKQAVYHTVTKDFDITVTKAFNQRLGPDHRHPVFVNKDLSANVENIPEKDWRPEKIRFFDQSYEKPGLVITINCQIYYQDVYTFVDWHKDVILLWLIKKTQDILL